MKACHVEIHPAHDSDGKLAGWYITVNRFSGQTDPRVLIAADQVGSLPMALKVAGDFAARYLE